MAVEPDDHLRARQVWEQINAAHTDDDGRDRWTDDAIGWGLFRLPEAELGVLGDVHGLDVIELGSGTAYLSAQLARLGARPIAVDLSHHQLTTARRCQLDHGPSFPLLEATAEAVPLASGCADLVVSEYGAAPWCDPTRWLAEAARLLRPGGRLVFLTNSVLAALCVPDDGGYAGTALLRPQREVVRVAWPGGGVEHHPGHGEWIAHLRTAGFTVDGLIELHATEDSVTPRWYEIVTAGWARRWPAEDLWLAQRS
jgi:SAM-dependent methyltransferase